MKDQLKEHAKVRREMDAKLDRQAQLAAAEKAELKAEMEAKMETLRKDLTPKPLDQAVSEGQLEALQARLESLHAAELLDDEALFALEGCVADFIDCSSAVASAVAPMEATDAANKVSRLVGLSERMPKDSMFARQAKRKFV